MSIHTDIKTALAAVAGGRVYPQIAPAESAYPLVNYRVVNKEPTVTIHGQLICTDYDIVFECWGSTYSSALSTADAVRAAIVASALNYSYIPEQGEDFDNSADMYMEPVYFRFLYQ